jgi:hypothetical protein
VALRGPQGVLWKVFRPVAPVDDLRYVATSETSNKGVVMVRRRSLRSSLYRDARILGNVEAAAKGPGSYAQRYARRRAYATTNGITRSFLRALGLSK